MASNIFDQKFTIDLNLKRALNGHNSFLIFITGLSGSGKSSLANALEKKLFDQGIRTFILDGDRMRKGINSDLGFDQESREENIRRVAHIGKILVDAGIIVIASFIAPYEKDRKFVKDTLNPGDFVEVYLSTSVKACASRDTKGLYARAIEGEIKNFTGVSAPYEKPQSPELEINTEVLSIEDSVELVYEKIKTKLVL